MESYLNLLSKNNPPIQKLSLDCIMTWKFDFLLPYKEHLEKLIDEKTFREEMILFNLIPNLTSSTNLPSIIFSSETENNTNSSIINITPEHRLKLSKYITLIMWPKLSSRKLRTGRRSISLRRSIILSYLSSLQSNELEFFFSLVLHPFSSIFIDNQNNNNNKMDINKLLLIDEVDLIPLSQREGFVHLLDEMFTQFGNVINPFITKLFIVLVTLLKHSIIHREKKTLKEDDIVNKENGDNEKDDDEEEEKEEEEDEDEEEDELDNENKNLLKQSKTRYQETIISNIRNNTMKRLVSMIQRFPGEKIYFDFKEELSWIINEELSRLEIPLIFLLFLQKRKSKEFKDIKKKEIIIIVIIIFNKRLKIVILFINFPIQSK